MVCVFNDYRHLFCIIHFVKLLNNFSILKKWTFFKHIKILNSFLFNRKYKEADTSVNLSSTLANLIFQDCPFEKAMSNKKTMTVFTKLSSAIQKEIILEITC